MLKRKKQSSENVRAEAPRSAAAEGVRAETLQLAIAEIAAEAWRYEQALSKVLRRMDIMEAERFSRQYNYFATRVDRAMESAGLTTLDLTGQPYSVGLPIQAMNLEEFDEDEPLIITKMVEPVIMVDNRVLKTGMAMVDRVREEV